MQKPNTLLKVVSIIYIIVAAIGLVLTVLAAVLGGAVLGMAAESAGLGVAVGGIMTVLLGGGSVLCLVAGILGVKGQFTGCKVLGIIILVFTVLDAVMSISAFDAAATVVVSAILRLVLPVLYVWGAFKGPAAD